MRESDVRGIRLVLALASIAVFLWLPFVRVKITFLKEFSFSGINVASSGAYWLYILLVCSVAYMMLSVMHYTDRTIPMISMLLCVLCIVTILYLVYSVLSNSEPNLKPLREAVIIESILESLGFHEWIRITLGWGVAAEVVLYVLMGMIAYQQYASVPQNRRQYKEDSWENTPFPPLRLN